jgi:osmotically-inducible protein OsmY
VTPYSSAPIPDVRLASAIDEVIDRDPVLHSHVHVAVADGVVTLSGAVATVAADWRAARLVSDFKGAALLVDEIVVSAPDRSEAEISKDVAGALESDPATRTAKVQAVVSGTKLTLGGTADSYSQRDLVAEVAARVHGIRQVILTVTVPRVTARADTEIAATVTDRLREDARLDGTSITAAALGGDAVLTGFVGSLAQRDAAVSDAMGAGAANVDAQRLQVDWREAVKWRISLPRPMPTDEVIASEVARTLSADVTLYGQPPIVRVEKGVVTLSGNVIDFRAARAATRDASRVSGVWRVVDETTVTPAKWESDATIEKQVLRGIYDDVTAPDSRGVQVLTSNGKVTLKGAVASQADRKVIEEDAEEEPGVVAVQNDVQVKGYGAQMPLVSPDAIRHAIVERLFWDPRIGGGKVDVTVASGGEVTLQGLVDTWPEALAASDDAVREGAAHVDNLVRVAGTAP